MASTVVGLFADRRAAQRAVVDLQAAGFDPAHITQSRRSLRPALSSLLRLRAISSTTGAILGALVLGTIGALIGWAAEVSISGSRGGGTLLFVGITLVGGMVGWLAGGLFFSGLPIANSPYLGQRYEEGAVVLKVQAGGREAVARHILARNGGKELRTAHRRFPIPAWRQPDPPRARHRTPAA